MKREDPSPETTLVVLLGAKEWPYSPDFHGSEAFANAARDFREYILSPDGFRLPQKNLLDLFNTEEGPDKIHRKIRQFLTERIAGMKNSGIAARDLLVYFVGHGGFVGRNSEYYLAVRFTSTDDPDVSGIRIESFVNTITENARSLHRIYILDCCYAGAAYRYFQAEGPAQVATRQMVNALKEKARTIGEGASLLCSSGKDIPSRLSSDHSYTMFSRALLHALTTGHPRKPDQLYLSLREVADLTEEWLRNSGGEVPRPEVHSPDQQYGDVADMPFFPNHPTRIAELRKQREQAEERWRQEREERERRDQDYQREAALRNQRQQQLDQMAKQQLASILSSLQLPQLLQDAHVQLNESSHVKGNAQELNEPLRPGWEYVASLTYSYPWSFNGGPGRGYVTEEVNHTIRVRLWGDALTQTRIAVNGEYLIPSWEEEITSSNTSKIVAQLKTSLEQALASVEREEEIANSSYWQH